MKQNTLAFLLLFSACEKKQDIVPAVPPSRIIGTWTLVIQGAPTDSFRIRVGSSLHAESVYYAGHASDGPVVIDLIENSFFRVNYRDTAFHVTQMIIQGTDTTYEGYYNPSIDQPTRTEAINRIDTLPATVFIQ